MHFAVVYGIVGALAVAVCLWRAIVAVRDPCIPARWAMTIALGCAAVGFGVAVPQTYSWLGRASGVPNLATLIVYAAETTAAFTQILWTTYVFGPDDGSAAGSGILRFRQVAAIDMVVVTVLAVLFFLAPVGDTSHPIDFDVHYATVPAITAFLAVYLSAFGWALVRIVWLCRIWIPQLQRGSYSRCGLVLLAIGSSIAVIGYCGGKAIAIVAAWAGVRMQLLSSNIAPACASAGVVVMLMGYASPSVIPRAIVSLGHMRARYRLGPLWTALCQAVPEVVQVTSPRGRRPVRERVYRQLIEIHDALVVLQPYLTPEINTRAADLATQLRIRAGRRAAAIEAARIAGALEALRSGVRPPGPGMRFSDPETPDLVGELAWYSDVALAFRRSPLVPAMLADLRDSAATGY